MCSVQHTGRPIQFITHIVDPDILRHEALEQILTADPAVLVLDINLPGRRGDDLASAVRAKLGRDVPVLFITGNNDFDPPKWARTDFLRKPFELEDLNRKVRGLAT